MEGLTTWRDPQCAERLGEPKSAWGNAISSLLGHWETLARFGQGDGAPLENNLVARA
jgi:hypothetical protein